LTSLLILVRRGSLEPRHCLLKMDSGYEEIQLNEIRVNIEDEEEDHGSNRQERHRLVEMIRYVFFGFGLWVFSVWAYSKYAVRRLRITGSEQPEENIEDPLKIRIQKDFIGYIKNRDIAAVKNIADEVKDSLNFVIDDQTPLIAAVLSGSDELVNYLLESGADVNFGSEWSTPLIEAIKLKAVDMTHCLVGNDANVNYQSKTSTPLIEAIKVKSMDIILYLIERGANINLGTEKSTPLIEAVKLKWMDTICCLVANKGDVNCGSKTSTPLIEAVRMKSMDIIRYLVSNGADVNQLDHRGETPLFHAIASGDMNIVKYFLDNVSVQLTSDSGGKTALIYAIERDKTKAVELIMKRHDLDVNAVNYSGYTALHLAVAKNRYQAAYIICHHPRVDFEIQDKNFLKAYEVSSSSSNVQSRTIVQAFADESLIEAERMRMIEESGVDIDRLPIIEVKDNVVHVFDRQKVTSVISDTGRYPRYRTNLSASSTPLESSSQNTSSNLDNQNVNNGQFVSIDSDHPYETHSLSQDGNRLSGDISFEANDIS